MATYELQGAIGDVGPVQPDRCKRDDISRVGPMTLAIVKTNKAFTMQQVPTSAHKIAF